MGDTQRQNLRRGAKGINGAASPIRASGGIARKRLEPHRSERVVFPVVGVNFPSSETKAARPLNDIALHNNYKI
jgi:hypothetical protein